MIQLISNARQLNSATQPVIQIKNNFAQSTQSQISAPYSKEYANASRSLALATININKTQTPSFKGETYKNLPSGWYFNAEDNSIREHYGVEGETPEDVKVMLDALSNDEFKAFIKSSEAKPVDFYRFMPNSQGSKWVHDGTVVMKENGLIEHRSFEDSMFYLM